MAQLVDDPAARRSRIATVAAALAASASIPVDAVELRVAGSLAQLGIVARLLSPLIGRAVHHERLTVINIDDVWWQAELGGPFPLSLPSTADSVPLAEASSWLIDGPVGALVDRFAATVSLSPAMLWGNVASVLMGALDQLARAGLPTDRVNLVRSAMLEATPLGAKIAATPPGWRRASCCLLYRLTSATPTPICGDCVFHRD